MEQPSIFIRIDQKAIGSQFKFDAQVCIGNETTGDVSGFISPVFTAGDEHECFVTLMQKITQAVLQFRDFRKQATEQDFLLLNAQGEEIADEPKVIVP